VNPANFAEPSGFAGNSTGGSSTDPRPFDLEGLKEKVKNKMKNRQFAEALTLLSLAYDNPDVSPNDEMYIVQILDTLAGEVIYSRNHSLEEPHIVKADETLETIADAHHVPALLLMRINGLRNPQSLAPGTTLKTVPGPFNAQISVRHMEMTLMLGGRYAGRFPVNLGSDPNRLIGMYTVRNKRSTIDTPVSSAEAAQGLGKPWIDLGDQTRSAHLNLQGAADLRLAGQGGGSATVYLSDQDMDDVYGILSIGSSVVIQR
jgi:LysM repeat protein